RTEVSPIAVIVPRSGSRQALRAGVERAACAHWVEQWRRTGVAQADVESHGAPRAPGVLQIQPELVGAHRSSRNSRRIGGGGQAVPDEIVERCIEQPRGIGGAQIVLDAIGGAAPLPAVRAGGVADVVADLITGAGGLLAGAAAGGDGKPRDGKLRKGRGD